MKLFRLVLALFLFPSLAAAQTAATAPVTVPVTIPQSMVTVPVIVNGLPAGCTYSATGGAQIIVTITSCAVTPPPPVNAITSVQVSGPTTVAANATATFKALVIFTGTPSAAVTWTATGGTMTGAVFTPAANATTGTITATSVFDPTKSGSASITITPVTVTPPPGTLAIGASVVIATPCAAPCHLWPNMSVTAGASGTPVNVTSGQAGTITAGPLTNTSGTWWQVKLTTGVTGWTVAANYTVTSGPVTTTHSAALSWVKPNSPSILNYSVKRGTTTGGPYAQIAKVASSVTTYTDPNLTSGSVLYYVTTALGDPTVYATVESSPSNEVKVTIP